MKHQKFSPEEKEIIIIGLRTGVDRLERKRNQILGVIEKLEVNGRSTPASSVKSKRKSPLSAGLGDTIAGFVVKQGKPVSSTEIAEGIKKQFPKRSKKSLESSVSAMMSLHTMGDNKKFYRRKEKVGNRKIFKYTPIS